MDNDNDNQRGPAFTVDELMDHADKMKALREIEDEAASDARVGSWLWSIVAVVAVGSVGALAFQLPGMVRTIAAASPVWFWPTVILVIKWFVVGLVAVLGAIHAIVAITERDESATFVFGLCLLVVVLFLGGCAHAPQERPLLSFQDPSCRGISLYVVNPGCERRIGKYDRVIDADSRVYPENTLTAPLP